jgi:integrase/recombinase XerD
MAELAHPISTIHGNVQGELEPVRSAPLQATTPWRVVLEAYLAGRDSEHTRRAYRRHIELALEAIGVATLTELNGILLGEWRAHIAGSKLAAGSQAQHLAALRSFLKWSRTFGAHALPQDVIAEALRAPRATVLKPYVTISEPEAGRLLAACTNPRDKALIALLLGAGLRAAELVGLDVGDVHEDAEGETVLHVRAGKGRKDRIVPVRAEVAGIVRHDLVATGRTLSSEGPLLLSEDPAKRRADRRLSTRAVGYLIDRLCERAGIDAKKISPHSVRHTFAIRALRAGASPVAAQKLLGHSSLSTTSRYLDHLELGELRQAVPELPASHVSDSAG